MTGLISACYQLISRAYLLRSIGITSVSDCNGLCRDRSREIERETTHARAVVETRALHLKPCENRQIVELATPIGVISGVCSLAI